MSEIRLWAKYGYERNKVMSEIRWAKQGYERNKVMSEINSDLIEKIYIEPY